MQISVPPFNPEEYWQTPWPRIKVPNKTVSIDGFHAYLQEAHGSYQVFSKLVGLNGLLFESLIIYFDISPELPPEPTSESERKPNQPSIVINQPWYYFYESNKDGKIPYKITKPTNTQI